MSLSKKGEGGATVNYNVITVYMKFVALKLYVFLTIKSETNYHLARTYTRFVAVNALPADR